DPHPTATFKNLCSILRVQLTGCETITSVTLANDNIPLAGGGTVAWSGENPTLTTSGGSKSITINLGNGILLNENNANEYYFILPSSGTSMSGMKVTTTFSQKLGTSTYTPSLTRSRNGSLAYGRSKVVKVALRAGFFSGGNGTQANPYQIKTANDLKYLNDVSKMAAANYGYFRNTIFYKQTANIDCSSITLNTIGENGNDNAFSGTYDGQNFTIQNGTLNNINAIQVGLFGQVNGHLKNIKLDNFKVSSTSTIYYANTGGLAGILAKSGTITNCHISNSTITGLKTGGLVGFIRLGTVDNCTSRNVKVTSEGSYVIGGDTEDVDKEQTYGFCGGVIGGATNATISNCSCYGANEDGTGTSSVLNGGSATGGIAGYIGNNDGTCNLSNCYVSNAQITSQHGYAGGIAGRAYINSTITGFASDNGGKYCVDNNKGSVSITGQKGAGGIVGYLTGKITGTKYKTNNYNPLVCSANITAPEVAGGIVGQNGGKLQCVYAYGVTVITTNGSSAGGIAGKNTTKGTITDCVYRNITVRAQNANGTYYSNVGGITGRMEGGSIDNSATTATSGENSIIEGSNTVGGMVGYMTGGTVTGRGSGKIDICDNTTVICHGNNCAIGIAVCEVAQANTTTIIKNITIGDANKSADVIRCNGENIGGIIGKVSSDGLQLGPYTNNNLKVECNASAKLVGGIVGYLQGNSQIRESRNNKLDITTAVNNVGGIVGKMDMGEVFQCLNYSSITGKQYVGGIAGHITGGTLYYCYSAGKNQIKIQGDYNVGGLAGYIVATNHVLILRSASRSDITGTSYSDDGRYAAIGGLVGRLQCKTSGKHATIADCVGFECTIEHTLSDARNLGGIVGFVSGDYAYIRNSYTQIMSSNIKAGGNTATTNDNWAGGIAGYLRGGNIVDCYYRCDQVGKIGGATETPTTTNHLQISGDAKNGKETIASIKMSDGKTYTNLYLYQALDKGRGMADKNFNIVYDNTANQTYTKPLGEWIYYTNVNGYNFAIPKELMNLGEDFYLN
ncbi:MAG: hypothetical protein II364_04645, partial [Bacteroidales bacterium]|nr:hypothetical protein [Bacteroidales bacterium]